MRLIDNPNPFKLVVFGANVLGGCNVSTSPQRIQVTWDETVRIAKAAEAAGLDAMIPISRWVGFGGALNHNDRAFETCTWAAGVAMGVEVGYQATFGDLHYAYFDTRHLIGCMTEVMEREANVVGLFQMIADASIDWDGKDPVRMVG